MSIPASHVETIEKYNEAHAADRAPFYEENLLSVGWLTSLFVPIVGFALGTILTVRQREGHGLGMMVSSVFMSIIWWVIIAAFTGDSGSHYGHFRY
jgi:hypothetical protein